MIAPALRLVAAVGAGAVLVGRPKSGVLHVYSGPLTPSGGYVPMSGRTVCRVRTRRLSVVAHASLVLDASDRRVCARCEAALPVALGRDNRKTLGLARDEWMAAFGHLSPALLRWAAGRCRTLDESHEIGRVATMVHGAKPLILAPGSTVRTTFGRLLPGTPDQNARWLMHQAIDDRRDTLRRLERTDDEQAAVVRARELEVVADQAALRARREEAAAVRLRRREVAGGFVMPWERRPAS